jgi:glutathione S-transferase
MTDIITLHFAPYTCARVPLIALEEIGETFDVKPVLMKNGEHKQTEYRSINPKGKVPALQIDGAILTENVAILDYLAARFPEIGLLPAVSTLVERAHRIADLTFVASTLHPIVSRIRMAPFFAGPGAAKGVWEKGTQAMDEYFTMLDSRLSEHPWWYGADWSLMDAYINWVFFRVEGACYDVSRFPALVAHDVRIRERPAVKRALVREKEIVDKLLSRNLMFRPPNPEDFI